MRFILLYVSLFVFKVPDKSPKGNEDNDLNPLYPKKLNSQFLNFSLSEECINESFDQMLILLIEFFHFPEL